MDDDRDLEGQELDVTATPRKRRAARGVRVPNDPVPETKKAESSLLIVAEAPEDEFSDRPTQLFTEGTAPPAPRETKPAAVVTPVLDLTSLREAEHSKTALDDPPKSKPNIEILDELDASADSDAEVEFTDDATDSMDMPVIARPAVSGPPTGNGEEEQSVTIRQVRRRIILTDGGDGHPEDPTIELPTVAAKPAESAVENLSETTVDIPSESIVEAHLEVVTDVAFEAPTRASGTALDDVSIVVPAVASAALSLPPPPPKISSKVQEEVLPTEALSMLDEMESLDAKARPIAVVEALSDTSDESAETDVVVEEHLDDGTEEISIPDEILTGRAPSTTPPTPPRISLADSEKPPPPPPPQQRATIPDTAMRATQQVGAAKPKRRQWWEEIFNDDYLRTIPKYTPAQAASEADFIEASLGVEKGATILDVGCGTGRQAVELASRGYDLTGLDLSLPMLSRASDAAQTRGLKINFVQADMGEIDFNESFDAAFCVGSTYGFFDDDKNNDIIQRLHRALKPGGTLLLEVVNRDCAAGQHPGMVWYEGEGCVCMEETNFNWVTSRLDGKRTLLMEDGRQKEQKFSLRLYSLHELGRSLHAAGFRVIEVSGHPKTPGAFFGTHSNQLIILAQKRAADA